MNILSSKKKIGINLLTPLILLSLGPMAFSNQEDPFKDAIIKFRDNKFKEYLKDIQAKKVPKNLTGRKKYLLGLGQSRLKNFNKANALFKKALSLKFKSEDIYYEYGQSLYAANNLEESRNFFFKSEMKKFKVPSSLYYQAYISHLLEEYKKSVKYYRRLHKTKEAPLSLKQVSQYQIGLNYYNASEKRKDRKKIVIKKVLPMLEKAIAMSPKSPLVKDIKKRKTEIRRKYDLDPYFLRNGKSVTEKAYKFSVEQKIKYDNNIALSTENPTVQVTREDSNIFETNLTGKYRFLWDRQFLLTPELKLSKTIHGERKSSNIYKNDVQSIEPSLKFLWEHKILKKQAAVQMDIDYKYGEKDIFSKKDMETSDNTWTFTIGYRIKLLPYGDSNIKYKFKINDSYANNESGDTTTNTFFFNQVILFPFKHLLIFTHQTDLTKYYNAHSSDSNTYLFRFDYLIPKIWPEYTLQISLSLTLLDPRVDFNIPQRKTEITTAPGIKISRKIFENFKYAFSYNYTVKISGNKSNFSYRKQVASLDFKYSF